MSRYNWITTIMLCWFLEDVCRRDDSSGQKYFFYNFTCTTFVVVGWCATEVKSSYGMVFFYCIGVAVDRTIDDVIEEPGDAVPRTGGALTVQVVSDLHMPSLKSSTPHMLRGDHRRPPSRAEFTNSLCSVGTYNLRWHNQYIASNRRILPRWRVYLGVRKCHFILNWDFATQIWR